MSALVSGIYPWIAGVLGGLTAKTLASWAWRKYTKPNLEFKNEIEDRFEINGDGEPKSRSFRIRIHNNGRTAAENCKPRFKLVGDLGNSRYEIKSSVCWLEADQPSRITINSDETASFELFRILAEEKDKGPLKTETEFYVLFPSERERESETNIIEWIYDESFENIQGANFHKKISKEKFESIEWKSNEVSVTSGNTDRSDAYVTLLPDVENAKGIVGMDVNVVPK